MNLFVALKNHLHRRQRVKKVTRAVQAYSRQSFPGTVPDWSLIAEDHPEECVVYQTYRRAGSQTALLLHRFFRVNLADLSVTSLDETYRPSKWGPYR